MFMDDFWNLELGIYMYQFSLQQESFHEFVEDIHMLNPS